METQRQLTIEDFSDPELEGAIQHDHSEVLKEAALLGKHYGKQNLPVEGDSLDSYTRGIDSKYEAIIARTLHKLRPESWKAEIRMLAKQAEEILKKITGKKEFLKKEIHNIKLEIEKKKDEGSMAAPVPQEKIPKGLILIGLAEIGLNVGGLQLMGGSWISALVISCGIAFAQFYLAKMQARHLKEYFEGEKKNKMGVLLTSLAMVFAFAVFYALAVFRSEYFREESKSHYEISPLIFLCFNAMFYLITLLFYYKNAITDADRKKYAILLAERIKREELKKKLAELQAELKIQEEQEQAIEQDLSEKKNQLARKPVYAKKLVKHIRKLRDEAIGEFVSNNLAFRNDKIPTCLRLDKTKKQLS